MKFLLEGKKSFLFNFTFAKQKAEVKLPMVLSFKHLKAV